MNNQIKVIIAEDDIGHAILIQKNLRRAGMVNEIIHLKDGQEVIDFFHGTHKEYQFEPWLQGAFLSFHPEI